MASRNYYISPSAISIVPNAYNRLPDYAIVNIVSGAKIRVTNRWQSDINGNVVQIGYSADLGYRTWGIEGGQYHLAADVRNDDVYIHLRIPRSGDGTIGITALAKWKIDIVGQYRESVGAPVSVVANASDYYFIHIATLSAPNSQGLRELSFLDTGELDTAQGNNNKDGGEWQEMFSNGTNYISVLKPFYSLELFNSIGTVIKKFTKEVTNFTDWIRDDTLATTSSIAAWCRSFFIRKDQNDSTPYVLGTGGLTVGDYSGDDSILGSGGCMVMQDGSSKTTTDFLYVRKKAIFTQIEVHELKAVGGEIVLSPAAMVCNKVEKVQGGYMCYFQNEEEDENGNVKHIYNEFVVGDQARCQTFNFDSEKGSARVKYYWRLVTQVGDNYIFLSETDCDTNSDEPESGDNIVSLGHRTDKERQNAQILSAVGSDAPSIKHYTGINSYALKDENNTFRVSPVGNRLTGVVRILAGSSGTENLGITGGGDNLLRNTGFYGNVETVELDSNELVDGSKELYSPKLDGWNYANAEAVVSSENTLISNSKSGFVCNLKGGFIEQQTPPSFLLNDYVVSLRGVGNIEFSYAGYNETLTFGEGQKVVVRFKATNNSGIFRLQGTGCVCEIMLEKGVVASNEWTRSSLDTDPNIEKLAEYNYLSSAIKSGATDVIGGLILTNIIELGNYVDKKLKEVTAGISGIYNTDNDVAVWGGGTLAQAMKAVRMFKDDPTYVPTEEEWDSVANAVITHGGRAILNDAIFRGSVYAENGYFKGDVYANNGRFNGEVHATSGSFRGAVYADSGTFNGTVNATDGEFHGKIAVDGGLVLSTKTIKLPTDKWLAGDCFLFVSLDSKSGFDDDGDGYPIILFPESPNEGSQYNVISNSQIGTIRLKLHPNELAKGVRILDLRVQESIAMDMPERTTFVYSNNYWIVVNKYR